MSCSVGFGCKCLVDLTVFLLNWLCVMGVLTLGFNACFLLGFVGGVFAFSLCFCCGLLV